LSPWYKKIFVFYRFLTFTKFKRFPLNPKVPAKGSEHYKLYNKPIAQPWLNPPIIILLYGFSSGNFYFQNSASSFTCLSIILNPYWIAFWAFNSSSLFVQQLFLKSNLKASNQKYWSRSTREGTLFYLGIKFGAFNIEILAAVCTGEFLSLKIY
jgi:hypothetical protein